MHKYASMLIYLDINYWRPLCFEPEKEEAHTHESNLDRGHADVAKHRISRNGTKYNRYHCGNSFGSNGVPRGRRSGHRRSQRDWRKPARRHQWSGRLHVSTSEASLATNGGDL